MINNKLLLAAGAAALSASFFSSIVTAATATGNASAEVLAPLSIVADTIAQMNFGQVSGDATVATTVVLTPGGGVNSTDGAGIIGGAPSAGNFDVTGAGTLAYDITLPPAPVTLTGTGFGGTMTVDTFTTPAASLNLVGGAGTFDVGATLKIGIGQAADTYIGTYDVTVNYQ